MSHAESKPSSEQSIANLRVLLLEALQAGMFVPEGSNWLPHHSGEVLYFADRAFGIERPAVLVLTNEIAQEILTDSVDNDFRSYIVVGARLASNVDLGGSRTSRAAYMAETGEQYWAIFVLENEILVAHGTPLSWCRLVAEVLNAQVDRPFVQQKICSQCNSLNPYHSSRCGNCGHPLTLTGKLG